MEPTKHQYDYDSATVHGFLVRNGLEGEYRVNIEANHATLAGHSFHHEVAYAVAHGILGSIDANRGDPQNGWDTDQFPNSVEELALAALRDPPRRRPRDRRLQLRRQAAPPEHRPDDLFHAHIGGIDTLARALLVAADLVETGRSGGAAGRRATPAGTATLGEGDPRRLRDASPTSRRASRPARSTPARVGQARSCLENLVNQSIWSGRPGRRSSRPPAMGRSSSASTSRRRRPRPSSSTRPARSAAIGVAEYGFDHAAPALERAGSGALVGRAPWPRSGRVLAAAGVVRRRRRGDRADRPDARRWCCSTPPDAVLRPAILWNDQRTAAECDVIRAAVGPERLIAITGNDALTGFTAPKLVWVRDHEPEVWARVAHVLLPKDYVRLRLTGEHAMDKADGAGHDPVRPRGPRLVARGRRRAPDPTRPGCRRRSRARR